MWYIYLFFIFECLEDTVPTSLFSSCILAFLKNYVSCVPNVPVAQIVWFIFAFIATWLLPPSPVSLIRCLRRNKNRKLFVFFFNFTFRFVPNLKFYLIIFWKIMNKVSWTWTTKIRSDLLIILWENHEQKNWERDTDYVTWIERMITCSSKW